MKTIVHSLRLTGLIVAKDLRRVRWALLLLGGLAAAHYVAYERVRAMDNAGEVARAAVLGLWGAQLLLAWLLVPQFVLEDPLLGPAEWRVRPISGARLLAAKLLGIFLALGVWPSVLTLPWWLGLGLEAGAIVRVMAVNALALSALAGVALAVAVIAESMARYIAWSLVLGAAVGMGALGLAAGMPVSGDGVVHAAVLMARAEIAGGIGLVAAGVIVGVQFLSRRPGIARGIAVGSLTVAGTVVMAWPWTMAEVQAGTGLARWAWPTVSARPGLAALAMPQEQGAGEGMMRGTTEFSAKGVAAGDHVTWNGAELHWRVGADRAWTSTVATELARGWNAPMAAWAAWALGGEARRDEISTDAWSEEFLGKLAAPLRNGEGLLRVRNRGTLWRGERGPVVAVRAGAWSGRGARLVQMREVETEARRMRWWEIEPLAGAMELLDLLNPDGVRRYRGPVAVLVNGAREFADNGQGGYRPKGLGYIGREVRIPVGLVTVTAVESAFDSRWSRGLGRPGETPVPFEGATLASVWISAAEPLVAEVEARQFLPELAVEGSLAETLRRAQTENRPALVRVPGDVRFEVIHWDLLSRFRSADVTAALGQRWVVGQATEAEAARLRKATDDEGAATLVVFDARGVEVDRLRDLVEDELAAALAANSSGKTYAATLSEALVAAGGTDRKLRFRLHEALRARGELAGAFNAILWLIENPQDSEAATELNQVGWRLERLVAVDGALKALLLERRGQAVETLRRDPGAIGAARLLWVTTLGLRHDDAIWREWPSLLPPENPFWWEFSARWLGRTVQQQRYVEATTALDVEKFWAAGPAWVRAQLAGRTEAAASWQRWRTDTGVSVVEALAGAGQGEAALRVAREVAEIDRTAAMRAGLGRAMERAGAVEWAERWRKEVGDGR